MIAITVATFDPGFDALHALDCGARSLPTAAGELLTLRVDRDTTSLSLVDTESSGAISEPGTIVTSSHSE